MSAACLSRTAAHLPKAAAAFATLVGALLGSRAAFAFDGEVTSDSSAQFYDLRSPTGETVIERRRFTEMLGLGVYNLTNAPPGDPKAPDLSLKLRLRYDADYGVSPSETDPGQPNSIVPGVTQGNVDLMYAYLEGRRQFGGLFGFKLGRQYVTDVLGWWSFDGGQLSVTTPFFVKAEVYGGLEQRGGMPLSSSRFEADGIWRGDRSNYPASLYPDFHQATVAPAVGAAIESTGVTWIHGRLTYRRVYNTGASDVTMFQSGLFTPAAYNGTRISSDRLGYAMDAAWKEYGGIKGGVVFDLYRNEITTGYASIDAYAGQKVTISADYDYYVPSFDADSIWNFFAGEPHNDVGLRANVNVTDHLSIAANGHVRVYSVQTAEFTPGGTAPYMPSVNYSPSGTYYPSNGQPFDEGGNLSVRWKTGETLLGLHGSGDFGDEGDRVGADASGEHVFDARYIVRGRAGVWQWKDNLQPDRDATGFNYVAGVGYRFAPRSVGSVEWEHDLNGLVGNRFRVMLALTLGLMK
ncbi:MAG TPA: hypothetical protein VK841_17615 [Polyangiaceae bacterium]|jgi:hypothetical protein|nr:hypothetical protein [Polyangiaceae bacterium]